ncbi:TrmH family RNA methyltransferase [Risungbinella massiliensis]|uniref:TrmH family RNA methyltransferase n=1 Tax=Risungbinella massiliensis TaxID=1329796 RepID=UPI00069C41FE|nr:RNA methyltransferase [Risungbinella massiliensis]
MTKVKVNRLESTQNDHVKRWKKLQTRKGREKANSMLIEGEHLLSEALKSPHITISHIIVEGDSQEIVSSYLKRFPTISDFPIFLLSPSLFRQIAETESPQKIMAEISLPKSDMIVSADGFYLLLDRIQDPGNLGTLLRTAQAVGVTQVIVGKGTVDPYNGKVVRSSMGAILHVPLAQEDLKEVILCLQQHKISVVGTSLHTEIMYDEADYSSGCAILLGNEGQGVDPALQEMVDQTVRIPMPGGTESLNVAIAGGLLLYEKIRQNRNHL